MTTPADSKHTPAADSPAAKHSAAQHFSRLLAFVAGPQSGPAKLGFLGSVLITTGGLGAGSTKPHDPLLEALHLSWLRFGHGLVLSSIVLWTGVGLMLIAWVTLGRRALAGNATEFTMRATTGFWLAPLLLSVPVFSRDTYSYLAQGALLRDGFDPYAVGPVANPNVLLDNVSPIWTITTAPYGPAFILVAKLVTIVVGNHVIAGTMLLRLCMLPGLALLMWAAPRMAHHLGTDGSLALWICVLNPLVLIHLMGGVHNEMLMVGLMAAGIALTFQGRHVLGVILIIAVSLPLLWWRYRRADRAALTGIAWSMLIVVLFVPAALPWYYSWPLAVAAPLAQSRRAVAAIAGLSTWVMVIFKPDGSHGMYSWLHFSLATACALAAWYALYRQPEPLPDEAEEPVPA